MGANLSTLRYKSYIKVAFWKRAALLQCHCCDTRHQTQDVPTSKWRCSHCLQKLDLLRASLCLQIRGKEEDFTRYLPVRSVPLPLNISDSSLSCLLTWAILNRSTTLLHCVFKNNFSDNLISTLNSYKWSPSGVYSRNFVGISDLSDVCYTPTYLAASDLIIRIIMQEESCSNYEVCFMQFCPSCDLHLKYKQLHNSLKPSGHHMYHHL